MTENTPVTTTTKAVGRPAKLADRVGMIIIGVFLVAGIVVFSTLFMPDFLRRGMQEDLAEGGGTLASARILSVSETGRWYAKRPILRFSVQVTPAGAAAFTTQFNQEVGLLNMGQFHAGTLVQLRYNPEKPSEAVMVNE